MAGEYVATPLWGVASFRRARVGELCAKYRLVLKRYVLR